MTDRRHRDRGPLPDLRPGKSGWDRVRVGAKRQWGRRSAVRQEVETGRPSSGEENRGRSPGWSVRPTRAHQECSPRVPDRPVCYPRVAAVRPDAKVSSAVIGGIVTSGEKKMASAPSYLSAAL